MLPQRALSPLSLKVRQRGCVETACDELQDALDRAHGGAYGEEAAAPRRGIIACWQRQTRRLSHGMRRSVSQLIGWTRVAEDSHTAVAAWLGSVRALMPCLDERTNES